MNNNQNDPFLNSNQRLNADAYYGNTGQSNYGNYGTHQEQNNKQGGEYGHGHSDGNFKYPVTNLQPHEALQEPNRVNIVLPENIKFILLFLTICCLLAFFVILLIK
jgi:hypothetical protein